MFSSAPKSAARLALLLAAASLASPLVSHAAETIPLTEWKFQKLGKGASSQMETVVIPHAWNASDDLTKKPYRGPAVYRRELGPGTAFAGKRVFLRCEAVANVSEILLNGKRVGEHRGAFTEFGFELTPYLEAGGTNTLEVHADNSPRTDVLPIFMDFVLAGGIYRPVDLVVCDPVCLNPVVDGTRGVTMAYGKASRERAAVTVTAAVSNAGAASTPVTVRFRLLDKAGERVAEVVKEIAAAPGDTRVSGELILDNPHLWNGVKDPYLYTTEVTVLVAGKTTDTERRDTGFRDIRIDPKKGFFLNGEHLSLHGVCRHQDLEGVSWALTREHHRADAAIIREMGANAVRLAHYPHSREFVSECDRLGLLVWSELPLFQFGGYPNPHPDLEGNAGSQLRELIRQQGGHASVFCWCLYNELGVPGNADYTPLVGRLKRIANEEDPSRPTSGATANLATNKALYNLPDIVGFNNYPGWYHYKPADLEKGLVVYQAGAPGKAWSVSEYGAGASVYQHDPNVAESVKPAGRWHPEEWQTRVHEGAYTSIESHPELWGSFVWCMFDYSTTGRSEGDRDCINDKGLVTRDRKTRKDAFYFYQANWSEKPVLRLASHRAFQAAEKPAPGEAPRIMTGTRMIGDTLPIRLYSNLTDIRVKFNGEELPAPEVYAPHAYATKPVKLRPGKNSVEATAKTASGETVTDALEWDLSNKSESPPPAPKPPEKTK